MKIAKVTPIYKAVDSSDINNHRPVSVISCFSKILERLIYNRLYKYLKENNILYGKEFDFQSRYSTNDAVTLLLDKVFYSFEKQHFTQGVFIDFPKPFHTVNIPSY